MPSHQGNCLCKAVKYDISGDIKKVVNCHCNLCRSMNGSAFSSYAVVLTDEFQITSGKTKSFSITEQSKKYFCEQCGTPIFNRNPKYAELTMVYLGTLTEENMPKPDVNIYCESELNWSSDLGGIPKFKQGLTRD